MFARNSFLPYQKRSRELLKYSPLRGGIAPAFDEGVLPEDEDEDEDGGEEENV